MKRNSPDLAWVEIQRQGMWPRQNNLMGQKNVKKPEPVYALEEDPLRMRMIEKANRNRTTSLCKRLVPKTGESNEKKRKNSWGENRNLDDVEREMIL